MSLPRSIGALCASAILAAPLFAAHAEPERTDIGALTAQCRWLITTFDHHVKSVPRSADKRSAWKLRAQGADECFGADSAVYTMKDGVADLARALREIGVDPKSVPVED